MIIFALPGPVNSDLLHQAEAWQQWKSPSGWDLATVINFTRLRPGNSDHLHQAETWQQWSSSPDWNLATVIIFPKLAAVCFQHFTPYAWENSGNLLWNCSLMAGNNTKLIWKLSIHPNLYSVVLQTFYRDMARDLCDSARLWDRRENELLSADGGSR